MFTRYIVFIFLTLCLKAHATDKDYIGFFSPQGINPDLVANTNFAMINIQTISQMKESLKLANNKNFIVNLDFGPLLAATASTKNLSVVYTTTNGKEHRKQLMPLAENKVRVLPSNLLIEKQLTPYLDEMRNYASVIGTVFLVDEPYLNGVSKFELERAGKEVKRLLNMHGLSKVKLGVIFASGMFDPIFAKIINRAVGDYAYSIDQYYKTGGDSQVPKVVEEWTSWKKSITASRLSTYDSAGNMYIEGGIPRGFEVVGFDFYLSTILQDGIHDKTLAWFAIQYPKQCGAFEGTSMRELRKQLSFFHNGPVLQGDKYRIADRKLLDLIYSCRMTATVDMLQKQIKLLGRQGKTVHQLLISESSNNGVLEFDSLGNIEAGQPEKLNEARVYDEVNRGLSYYRSRRQDFKEGLMFFTYQDEYDKSIMLNVGGAKNMPSVLNKIYSR